MKGAIMVELLSPAGNFEKMKMAFLYGADAVYLAGERFGMRAAADNFTNEELCRAVEFAHRLDRKVYLTLNTMPRESEYPALREFLSTLAAMPSGAPDGIIAADIGVMGLVREYLPKTALHISTQAGVVSSADAAAWHSLGASRVVLARELSLGGNQADTRQTSGEYGNRGVCSWLHVRLFFRQVSAFQRACRQRCEPRRLCSALSLELYHPRGEAARTCLSRSRRRRTARLS